MGYYGGKSGGGSGLAHVSDDTAPKLGGDLDLNGKKVGAATAAEVGYLSGVSSALQTQITAKADAANLSTHTANTLNPHSTTAAQVSAYTSAQVDTLLAGKQATITGAGTTIVSSNLTASRVLVSDTNGKVAIIAPPTGSSKFLQSTTAGVLSWQSVDLSGYATVSYVSANFAPLNHSHALSTITIDSDLNLAGFYRVTNLGSPIYGTDAATKAYVDAAGGGGGVAILNILYSPDSTPGRLYIDGMSNRLTWVDSMGMQHQIQEGP